jgi:hypothetical protein
MQMPGMNMPMPDMNPAAMSLMNLATGTSANPASWPMPMLMTHLGSWNAMFMGTAFVVDTQQSGPRGGDKLYSTNWFMGSAEHRAGAKGAFQVDLMLSLEPATITGERYPELFQTGETAYGRPLFDAQHPHNFIMALGFHYAYEIAEDTTFLAYFAPVGDPALGPVAFPHRASAGEFTAPSPEKIAGSSSRVPLIRGPRGSGFSPPTTGPPKSPSDASCIRRRSSPAIRSGRPRRSATPARTGPPA